MNNQKNEYQFLLQTSSYINPTDHMFFDHLIEFLDL